MIKSKISNEVVHRCRSFETACHRQATGHCFDRYISRSKHRSLQDVADRLNGRPAEGSWSSTRAFSAPSYVGCCVVQGLGLGFSISCEFLVFLLRVSRGFRFRLKSVRLNHATATYQNKCYTHNNNINTDTHSLLTQTLSQPSQIPLLILTLTVGHTHTTAFRLGKTDHIDIDTLTLNNIDIIDTQHILQHRQCCRASSTCSSASLRPSSAVSAASPARVV
jgi:hypothetical protein